MRPGRGGGDPPTRGTGQQAFAYEEGFGDLLDRLALLSHGDRESGEADGAAAEELDQRFEDGAVEPVEATAVHLVDAEGHPGDVTGDVPVGLDLRVVTDPTQQSVGDTGVPRERPAISAAPWASISTSRRFAERWMTRSSSAGS